MLPLLTLLGDPGRILGIESAESARGADTEADFDSLFAVASGAYARAESARGDELSGGIPLPAPPMERQGVAATLDEDLPESPVAVTLPSPLDHGLPDPAAAAGLAASLATPFPGGAAVATDPAATTLPGAGAPPSAAPADARTGAPPPMSGQAANESTPPAWALAAARPAGTLSGVSGQSNGATAPVPPELRPSNASPRPVAAEPSAALGATLGLRPDLGRAVAQPGAGAAPAQRTSASAAKHAAESFGDDHLLPAGGAIAGSRQGLQSRPTDVLRAVPAPTLPGFGTGTAMGSGAAVAGPVGSDGTPAALHAPPPAGAAAWAAVEEGQTGDGARTRASLDATTMAADPGLLTEPARVRQAAEILRQWQVRSATAEASAADAAVSTRHTATSSGTAAPATAPATAPAAPAEAPVLSLANGEAAAEQLVQRMLQGQARNSNSLRFQLSPAELGQLQVNMHRQGDRLQITFTASHAGARDLIEASLPSLRSLLSDVGIQLTDADVRHEAPGRDASRGGYAGSGGAEGGARQQGGGSDGRAATAAADPQDSVRSEAGQTASSTSAPGGIDAFA